MVYSDKLHQMKDTIYKLSEVFLSNKDESISNVNIQNDHGHNTNYTYRDQMRV